MARVVELLAGYLQRQRERGRSAAADVVRGAVIEDGEAEGLVAELTERWAAPPPRRLVAAPQATGARAEIASRADQGAIQGAFLPLRHAARAFDLSAKEYDALLLALAVELDPSFGRLAAYLNDHAGRPRPTPTVFGEATRAGNKSWLIKRIAWRLQALAEGDLSERARQRAKELANDADLRLSPPWVSFALHGEPLARPAPSTERMASWSAAFPHAS
jgi:hypothetical protein